jgi:hypothetical protein
VGKIWLAVAALAAEAVVLILVVGSQVWAWLSGMSTAL